MVVQTLRGFGEGGELGLSPVGAQRAELQHLLDEISASQEGSQSARDLVAQTVREFSEGKPLSARSPSEERAVVMMQSVARGWMANEQAELLRLAILHSCGSSRIGRRSSDGWRLSARPIVRLRLAWQWPVMLQRPLGHWSARAIQKTAGSTSR